MEIKQINILRFVAAFGILIFHFGRNVQSLEWGNQLWDVSNTAVSFFFFLSGFVLVYAYTNRGLDKTKRFYMARFARIFPLYGVALFLTALPLFAKSNIHLIDFLLSIFMIQAWVPGYSQVLNTPGWAISVQLLFYMLFPFILPHIKNYRSNKRILVTMFVLWSGNLFAHIILFNLTIIPEAKSTFIDFVFYHPITHFTTLLLGGFAATLYIRNKEIISRFSQIFLFISICSFLLIVFIPNPILKYHHNGLFCPLFFLAIIGLSARNDTVLSKVFSQPIFIKLGNISYAIYILQRPLFYFFYGVISRLNINLTADQLFWLFIVFIMLSSLIAYHFIEVPFRKKIVNFYR